MVEEEGGTVEPEVTTAEPEAKPEPRSEGGETGIVNTSPKTMGNRCKQQQLKEERLPKNGRGGNLVVKDHPTNPISLHTAPRERSGLKKDLSNRQTPCFHREAR